MTHITLREQAARAIYESDRGPNDRDWDDGLDALEQAEYLANADAAVGVVLAAVHAEFDALPYWQPGLCGQQVETYRGRVLAVVARLGGEDHG